MGYSFYFSSLYTAPYTELYTYELAYLNLRFEF